MCIYSKRKFYLSNKKVCANKYLCLYALNFDDVQRMYLHLTHEIVALNQFEVTIY